MEYTVNLGKESLRKIASAIGGVEVEPLEVTQNGEYTAPDGKAYSPVSVNVEGGGGGSSDFSTAEVTVINEDSKYVDLALPYLRQGSIHSFLNLSPTPQINVLEVVIPTANDVYALIELVGSGSQLSVNSGDAIIENGMVLVSGDCSISVKDAGDIGRLVIS